MDESSFFRVASEADIEDNYDIDDVVDKMLTRRERKIPGSVYKPHNPQVILILSASLGQPKPLPRVFFIYPKYCFRDENDMNKKGINDPRNKQNTPLTSESMK